MKAEDSGTDFLVGEAVREKKKYDQDALLKKWGGALTALTAFVGVAMAFCLYANLSYRSEQEALGDRFHEAVAPGETPEDARVTKLKALSETSDPVYRLLAQTALAARGKTELTPGAEPSAQEQGAYRQLLRAANRNDDPRELASFLKLTSYYRAFAGFDKADEATREKLAAETAKAAEAEMKDGAWGYSYRELSGLMLLDLGKEAEAGKVFSALASDASAPENMRKRAGDLLKTLGLAPAPKTTPAAS